MSYIRPDPTTKRPKLPIIKRLITCAYCGRMNKKKAEFCKSCGAPFIIENEDK